MLISKPRTSINPPGTWKAICLGLGWPEKVAIGTWLAIFETTDPYVKGLAANMVLTQTRLQHLSYDQLGHFVRTIASPRALTRSLELAVSKGLIKRRLATSLEECVFANCDSQGQWKA